MKKIQFGELIVPVIALLYVCYTITSQIVGGLHTDTILYSVFLALFTVVFALVCIAKNFTDQSEEKLEPEKQAAHKSAIKRMLLFLGWAALILGSLPYLGYIISFTIYLFVMLWKLQVRPLKKTIIITLSSVLLIHFVFVVWVGLPLPKGILEEIL